jgi:hypothetical protein
MRWRECSIFLWVLAAATALAQTDGPPAKPGLYRGAMTISSPEYGATKTPVKRTAKVVARVEPGNLNTIKAVIRGEPRLTLIDPVPNFILVFDGKDQDYGLQEQTNTGTIEISVNVTFRRGTTIIIEQTVNQMSDFGSVSSPNHYRIILNRIGP